MVEIVTVSQGYRVTIPRAIREELNIQPGQKMQVLQYQGRIELIPLMTPRQARGFLKGIDTTVEREPDRE